MIVHDQAYKQTFVILYNADTLVNTDLQYHSMLSFIAANTIKLSCLTLTVISKNKIDRKYGM